MLGRVIVVGVVAAVGTTAGAAWAFGPSELGMPSSRSDNFRAVEKDRSWLDYLPESGNGPANARIEIASLNKGADKTRRIDLLETAGHESIALCFARTEAALQVSCPGAKTLGKVSRAVDAPWVGQLGTSSVNFLALLNSPAPTLDEAQSIRS